MKKAVVLFLSILTFMGCRQQKTEEGYSITGTVPDGIEGWIYLQEYKDREYRNIDSSHIVDRKFSFSGSVPEPRVYALHSSQKAQRAQIFLENAPTEVLFNNEWEIESIKGSENTELFQLLLPESRKGTLNADSLIVTNPSSPVAVYFLTREIYKYDFDELKILRNTISDSLSGHSYVKEIDETLTGLERVQPGKEAPDFTLETVNGDSLSLQSLRGQYVLIDFWASWCPDCRKSNPHLVKFYNQFKNRNFTILGVSIDEDKDRWKDAIEKDGLAWPQLITPGGWHSDVVKTYALRWIPTGVLVDPEGTIIARSIQPETLESYLKTSLRP
ncbi:MAG TPA: thiol-disulfide isomerase [Porphyromonadaceae bacterium]|jgi:peroxiredoxin|nr:thiol-disulfide isomerase [Porphyromonadaceae bacterium]HCM20172.1 thiol-disulfide isomerase [Porphyromonadaceae bacterium]